jgi:signal transduction histidine kinase
MTIYNHQQMKWLNAKNTLFWKLSLSFLILFIILGFAYVFITIQAARRYVDETTQRLNSKVAFHMIEVAKPFVEGKVNKDALGDLMHSMMAVNPTLEVYLLDPEGKILSFVVVDKKVKLNQISLDPVKQFLKSDGKEYVLGDDPRNPGGKTIFSAAPILEKGKIVGYAYLVLASEEYENSASTFLGSYWLRVGTRSFIITLIAAFFLGLVLISILTKNLRSVISTVERFENGDLKARLPEDSRMGELAVLSRTFNRMAETLLRNIEDLKNVDQLRRELIANVSHDLRNPLAVIHGYIETLIIKDEDISPGERNEYLEIIIKTSEKLKFQVDDLFELSKLEAGEVKIHKERILINELLYDVSKKYLLMAKEKGIEIKYNIQENLPFIFADISLMERVIQNLMDNAIKYTPEKGWINLEVDRKKEAIKVSIQNSGDGIHENDLNNIFDRYYKVDNEKLGVESTGLGLAIVKKILDLHNFKIQVKSIPQKATSFYFSVPVYN